jgi:hypothetical protein
MLAEVSLRYQKRLPIGAPKPFIKRRETFRVRSLTLLMHSSGHGIAFLWLPRSMKLSLVLQECGY